LACTTPQPALGPLSGAAKYPAGARPSKCIIIIIIQKNSEDDEGKTVGDGEVMAEENSEPISEKPGGKEGEVSLRNLREKGEERGECKTPKLGDLKDSVFEASRPPALILPEGDHGYRRGTPPYGAEPREEKSQEKSGPLLRSYEDLIMEVGRTARRYSAAASPQSPRAYFVPEKKSSETQTIQETSATDSEKSEPRTDQGIRIKIFQGLQHTMQNLSQGIK
jgi:hypothetical protein